MPEEFRVTKIVSGDTFEVVPDWRYEGKAGCRVRLATISTPEQGQDGFEECKNILCELIADKEVGLVGEAIVENGALMSDIYINGKNVVKEFDD